MLREYFSADMHDETRRSFALAQLLPKRNINTISESEGGGRKMPPMRRSVASLGPAVAKIASSHNEPTHNALKEIVGVRLMRRSSSDGDFPTFSSAPTTSRSARSVAPGAAKHGSFPVGQSHLPRLDMA